MYTIRCIGGFFQWILYSNLFPYGDGQFQKFAILLKSWKTDAREINNHDLEYYAVAVSRSKCTSTVDIMDYLKHG